MSLSDFSEIGMGGGRGVLFVRLLVGVSFTNGDSAFKGIDSDKEFGDSGISIINRYLLYRGYFWYNFRRSILSVKHVFPPIK
jgi:hypothetical protein